MLFVSSYYSVTAVQSVLHDREYVHAVQRMHQYDMTVYNDPQLFRPLDHVTRQEAAKFFAVYADQFAQASDDRDTSVHCLFDDLGDADSTLVSYIHLACAQWSMLGSEGLFYPFDALTKAQAITIIVRVMSGMQDESAFPWRSGYFQQARVLWLTRETDVWALDAPASRYELALLLYRSQSMDVEHMEQRELDELKQLLLELGVQL